MDSSILSSPITFSVAKSQLSALTNLANDIGQSFVVEKNHKPWVKVTPLAVKSKSDQKIRIKPLTRKVQIPDLDDLFDDYSGTLQIQEDGFSSAVGLEAL